MSGNLFKPTYANSPLGALIIVLTAIYIFARSKKVDLFSVFRHRELRKGRNGKWYGWRRKELVNLPPNYSSEASFTPFTFVSEEKKPYFQQSPQEASPQQEAPKQVTQQDVPQNWPILAPVSPVSPMSVVFPPLHIANPDSHLSRAAFSPGYQRITAPFIAGTSREQKNQLVSQNYAQSNLNHEKARDDRFYADLDNYNNTIKTNTTVISNNTINDAYDPAQREVNHLSYLSSLSSGFGDQILIPRVAPTQLGSQYPRKSTQSSKYSWTQSFNNRDTQYTDVSVETAPHYRTVNSWVSHQAGRNDRNPSQEDDIPKIPNIPYPLQVHQRNKSSNPAFRQHPGNEIELQKKSRIPSQILDRKTSMD